MGARFRLSLLLLFAIGFAPRAVSAASITVAEFRWDIIINDTEGCSAADPACLLSVFSLTDLWDGPAPGPTLTNNQLTLSTGALRFLDLQTEFPFNFDQLAESGIPTLATISTSFLFDDQTITLGATLTQPNTFAVLQFDPTTVPEPGTFGLLAVGILILARRARRVTRRS